MKDCIHFYTKLDKPGKISSNYPLSGVRYSKYVDKADYLVPYIRIKVPLNYVSSANGVYVLLKDVIDSFDMLYPTLVYRVSSGLIKMFDGIKWVDQLKRCNYDPVSYIRGMYKKIDLLPKLLSSGDRYHMWYKDSKVDCIVDCRDVSNIERVDGGLSLSLPTGTLFVSYKDADCIRLYSEKVMSEDFAELGRVKFQTYFYPTGSFNNEDYASIDVKSPVFRINITGDTFSVYCGRKKLSSMSVEVMRCCKKYLYSAYRVLTPNENGNVWLGKISHTADDEKLSYVRPEFLDIKNSDALYKIDDVLYTYCNPAHLIKKFLDPTYVFGEYEKCLAMLSHFKELAVDREKQKHERSAEVEDVAPVNKRNIFYNVEFLDDGKKFRYVGKNKYMLSILGRDTYDRDVLHKGKDGESVFILKGVNTIELASVDEIYDVMGNSLGYTVSSKKFIKGVIGEGDSDIVRCYHCIADSREYLLELLMSVVGREVGVLNWKKDLIIKNKYNRYGGYSWVINSSSYIILGFDGYRAHYNKYTGKVSITGNTQNFDKSSISRSLSTPVINKMKRTGNFIYNVYDAVGGNTSSSRKYVGNYKTTADIVDFSKKFPTTLFHVSVLSLKDKDKKIESWSMKNGKIVFINGKKVC